MTNRREAHRWSIEETVRLKEIMETGTSTLDEAASSLGVARERISSAAIRKVREAVMTANAAIALVPPQED